MSKLIELTWNHVWEATDELATRTLNHTAYKQKGVYGIPTGGIFVALDLSRRHGFRFLERPVVGCLVVDDLVDSGRTLAPYHNSQEYVCDALFRKPKSPKHLAQFAAQQDGWLQFPWEHASAPEDAVVRLLQYIGEDPTREGLLKTPQRVTRAWKNELFSGYQTDIRKLFTVFEDGACDELVLLQDIEMFSFCEHHLLPFYGKAHVAYLPDKKVIGVSKLARIVDAYSRRMQIQERIGQQVTDALNEHLQPRGAACVISAQHLCMKCRGVQKQNSVMTTSSLTGAFRTEPQLRMELMMLIGSGSK